MADPRSVLESWFDAIEAKDVERITGMMADDVSMETEMLRRPITGKKVLGEFLAGALDAYESIRIEPRKIVASGRDVAALVDMRVRFGADVEALGEKLPTAGKEVNIVGALFAEVNEAGKIARLMRVRDTLGIVQQLGISPERVRDLAQKFEQWMKEPPAQAA